MAAIYSQIGYSFHIPVSMTNKENLMKHNEFAKFVYSSDFYFKFPKNNELYLNYHELVLRGFLVSDNLLATSKQWHYILVDNNRRNSNQLCSNLLKLKPNNIKFENSLYGKKDDYFDRVPLDCLHQYYNHISKQELFDLCEKSGKIKTHTQLRQMPISIINEVMTQPHIIKRLMKMNFYYLEDLLSTKDTFLLITKLMKKNELQMTQEFLIRNYKNI